MGDGESMLSQLSKSKPNRVDGYDGLDDIVMATKRHFTPSPSDTGGKCNRKSSADLKNGI